MRPFDGVERPLAKVCGLTCSGDVQLALGAGADLVGFVSYEPSPRHVVDADVVALARLVHDRDARSVLVVVDGDRQAVDALVEDAGLDAVQLCGEEEPDDWWDVPYLILRRLGVDTNAVHELNAWIGVADAFVLDHPAAPGGTGRVVDATLADDLARRAPCLLAGGLDGDALESGLPAPLAASQLLGFDASSRLEIDARHKDPTAVRRFVHAAHAAVQSSTSRER